MKKALFVLLAALAALGCGREQDEQPAASGEPAAESTPVTVAGVETVRARLAKDFPDFKDAQIAPAPVAGLYEIWVGNVVGYLTSDGKYLFDGSLIELETKTNLTEVRRNTWRKEQVDKLAEEDMLIYEPKKVEQTVTVFTDPQCGFCKKFQSEMDGYLGKGIRVRYMFVPIFGDKSKKLSENVWCAKDRLQAYTDVMTDKKIEDKTCKNPLEKHMEVAAELGIRGTPGILAQDGRLLRGYMPPAALKAELDGKPLEEKPLEDQAPKS